MKQQRERDPWIGSNWAQQRRNLDADKEMHPLFHDFALRCTDRTIRYPSGDFIKIIREPFILWNIDNRTLSESELKLDTGAGVAQEWAVPGHYLNSWATNHANLSLPGGETVRVSMGCHNLPSEDERIMFSIRRRDSAEPGGWATARGGEWREVVVPGETGSWQEYEILTSGAPTDAASARLVF